MSTKKDKKDKDKTKDKDKDKDKNDKNKVEKGKDDKEKAKDAPATLHAPTTDSVPSIKTLSRQEVKFTRNESGDYIFQIDHSGLIGQQKYCDLVFVYEFGKDAHYIMVNKPVVDIRCPKLMDPTITKPSKKVKKGIGLEVDQEKIRMQELLRIIHYLYSDQVDFSTLDLMDCIRLSKAATLLSLPRLQQMCDKHLQDSLTMENIFDLLKFSDANQVESSKTVCLEFALQNHKQFILDSRVSDLDVKLFQWVIINKERVALIENWTPTKVDVSVESTLKEDFQKLYEEMQGADVTFEVEGQKVKAHRALLAHVSPKLAELIEKKEPIKLPEKEYENFTLESFQSLLKFIYYFDTNIKPLAACQLIHFAKDFNVPHLGDVCEHKIRKGISVKTVLPIMQVAYSATLADKPDVVAELKTQCSAFFVNHLKEIDLEPLANMPASVATDLLLSLQSSVGQKWIIPEKPRASTTDSAEDSQESSEKKESESAEGTTKQKRKFKRMTRETSMLEEKPDVQKETKSEENAADKDAEKKEESQENKEKDNAAQESKEKSDAEASQQEAVAEEKKKKKKKESTEVNSTEPSAADTEADASDSKQEEGEKKKKKKKKAEDKE